MVSKTGKSPDYVIQRRVSHSVWQRKNIRFTHFYDTLNRVQPSDWNDTRQKDNEFLAHQEFYSSPAVQAAQRRQMQRKLLVGMLIGVFLSSMIFNMTNRSATSPSYDYSGAQGSLIEQALYKPGHYSISPKKRLGKAFEAAWKMYEAAMSVSLRLLGFKKDSAGGFAHTFGKKTYRIYPKYGAIHIIVKSPSGPPNFFMAGYAVVEYDLSGHVGSITYMFGPSVPKNF